METMRTGEPSYVTYLITSCKGGVGKSTVTANLAMAVCRLGHRVLVVDCDFSNRSLDLILGCENKVVYDICDLALGHTTPGHAVIRDRREERLAFISAPLVRRESFTTEQFAQAIASAASEFSCDTVIVDTPGASDDTLSLVAPAADGAVIVASHQPTSVRGAEKTGYMLEELGITEQHLIINRFDGDAVIAKTRPGLNTLIDRTHVPLIGVIPESRALELAQENGRLAVELGHEGDAVKHAFDETARRLCHERVPLLAYVPRGRRKKLLYT